MKCSDYLFKRWSKISLRYYISVFMFNFHAFDQGGCQPLIHWTKIIKAKHVHEGPVCLKHCSILCDERPPIVPVPAQMQQLWTGVDQHLTGHSNLINSMRRCCTAWSKWCSHQMRTGFLVLLDPHNGCLGSPRHSTVQWSCCQVRVAFIFA